MGRWWLSPRFLLAIASACIGFFIGVMLLSFMSPHLVRMLDKVWVRGKREVVVEVNRIQVLSGARSRRYLIDLSWKDKATGKELELTLEHDGLYDHVRKHQKPPFALRLESEIGKTLLTGRPAAVRIGPIWLPSQLKLSQLLLFFILNVLGCVLIFVSIRDIFRRLKKKRQESWISQRKKSSET